MIAHRREVVMVSISTDGVDGRIDAAGALADGEKLRAF
jgi:glycerate-2-kinase